MLKSIIKKIIAFIYYPIGLLKKRKLLYTDFTIISNNCWAGSVYNEFNLKYQSPTVGLYIFPDDYIRFIKNLKKYISIKLDFINVKKSKYYKVLKSKNQTSCPIARLDDVEIIFLHYKDQLEAKMKWNRRKSRINYNRIIFKFNDQNGCSESNIKDFLDLELPNKIFFTSKKHFKQENVFYFKRDKGKSCISNDTSIYIYRKYINTIKFLNNSKTNS